MTTKPNLDPKEIYRMIDESNLSPETKDRLHDRYREKHIEVTKEAQARLEKLRKWREKKIIRLQNKVQRRLK